MTGINSELRKDCPMRCEIGNCTPVGGFCTAVNDSICEALHNAYDVGWRHRAIRVAQQVAGKDANVLTNADRIRAMSNEELAKDIWKAGRNYRVLRVSPADDYAEYMEILLDWLQQPAEEDK